MRHSTPCALLALALAAAALLTGCGGAASPAASASSAAPASSVAAQTEEDAAFYTFTDDLGREVTVEAQPRRVAALIGSYADIWCTAGGTDTLVAAASDTWTDFDLGLGEEVADLGGVKSPSIEDLLASEPDLVLASTNTTADLEMQSILEAAGVTVAYFGVDTFEDYLRMLEVCTALTGCPENYQTYGTDVAAQVEDARAKAAAALETQEAPTVLYIRAAASLVKAKGTDGNVLGAMLADLGCVNIADQDDSVLEDLSMEAILAADPDKIFFVLQGADPEPARAQLEGAVLSNPAWQELTAVQNGEYYYMDKNLYHLKPNARWGEAYQNLVEILYGA